MTLPLRSRVSSAGGGIFGLAHPGDPTLSDSEGGFLAAVSEDEGGPGQETIEGALLGIMGHDCPSSGMYEQVDFRRSENTITWQIRRKRRTGCEAQAVVGEGARLEGVRELLDLLVLGVSSSAFRIVHNFPPLR